MVQLLADYFNILSTVRKFSDTDKRKNVLETFNNVNLDLASPNYIKKVIGDRVVSIDKMVNKLKLRLLTTLHSFM